MIATRAGGPGAQIVVVANRAALGRPALAQLSGTAVLLELARVLAQGPLRRTVTLVSTSGNGGGAAAAADELQRPVDAVLVLGDLASREPRQPLIVAWSNGGGVAPLRLQRTVARRFASRPADHSAPGTPTQLARFAFPFALGEQGVFGEAGLPAVTVSVNGERGPSPRARVSLKRMAALGRAMLRAVTALDRGPGRRRRSPGRRARHRAQVAPELGDAGARGRAAARAAGCAVDGFARLRRRREPIVAWSDLDPLRRGAVLRSRACSSASSASSRCCPTCRRSPSPRRSPSTAGPHRDARVALVFVLTGVVARAVATAPAVGAGRLGGRRAPGRCCSCSVRSPSSSGWSTRSRRCCSCPRCTCGCRSSPPGWRCAAARRWRSSPSACCRSRWSPSPTRSSLGLSADDFAWLWLLLTAAGHMGVGTWVVWSLFCGCVLGTVVLALRPRRRG